METKNGINYKMFPTQQSNEKKITGSSLFLINKNIFLSSDVEIECEAKFSISFKS